MSSLGTNERLSYMDSSHSTIDVTARFGGSGNDAPRFGTDDGAPKALQIPPTARFGGDRSLQDGRTAGTGGLLEVEALGTNDVLDAASLPASFGRDAMSSSGSTNARLSPQLKELGSPSMLQDHGASFAAVGGIGALHEITQNLRKTMVGLSNEVKARENEDWRLEQGFTQLDSRRELMCVQLHTRYEQSRNELEALGKQFAEIQRRSEGFREVQSECTQKLEECSVRVMTQYEETRRVGLVAEKVESETSSLKAMLERLQEKHASLEARSGAIEAKTSAAIARIESAPGDQSPSHAALAEVTSKLGILERRCEQMEDAVMMHKAEANLLRQTVAESKSQLEHDMDTRSGSYVVKMDSMQESFAQLQALLQTSDEKYRMQFRDVEQQSTGYKSQLESLQESFNLLQARQQQRLADEKQVEQLEARSAGYEVRIESLQQSIVQLQAWSQQQSLVEQKRSQIDEFNRQHRADTDDLKASIRSLEAQRDQQTPVEERTVALDAREATQRAELEKFKGSVFQLSEAVSEIRSDSDKLRAALSAQIDEKCALWEARLSENNAGHSQSVDMLKQSVSNIEASGCRIDAKLEERCGQDERYIKEFALLQVAQSEVQTRLESFVAQADMEKTGFQSTLQELKSRLATIQAKAEADKAWLETAVRGATEAETMKAQIGDLSQQQQQLLVQLELIQSKSELEKVQLHNTLRSSVDNDGYKAVQQLQKDLQLRLETLQTKFEMEKERVQNVIRDAVGTESECWKMELVALQQTQKELQSQLDAFESRSEIEKTQLQNDLSRFEMEKTQIQSSFREASTTDAACLRSQLEVLQQVQKELSSRLEASDSKFDREKTQLQEMLKQTADGSRVQGAADSERLTAQIVQLEVQGAEQQRESTSLRGLVNSLQGRMEAFQVQAEGARHQLEEVLKKECESVIVAQLEAVQNESRGIEQLFQKLEASALSLRNFVEAEASGTQAGIKRLEAEFQEDRSNRADEVKTLEAKNAEQHGVLAEIQCRLDSQLSAAATNFKIAPGGDHASSDEASLSEQRAQLATLRMQLQAGTEALQVQHDAMRSQFDEHVLKNNEGLQMLESRLLTTELSHASTSAVQKQDVSGEHNQSIETMVLSKVNAARAEFMAALEQEHAHTTENVRLLSRSISDECRTQAAAQARIVVQNLLAQELDAFRVELNSVSESLTKPGNKPTPGEADEDSRPEPPGLAEAVKRLDDRVAMQRREAGALDELLRSELEVQRRQQSLTSASMQQLQQRLVKLESKSDAMRTQLEDTLREDVKELESMSFGIGLASVKTTRLDGVDQVPTAAPTPQPPTGDEIHRRIKALSAKMASCQDSGSSHPSHQGSLTAPSPLGVTGRGVTLESARCSKPEDPLFDALNMPQAMHELSRANAGFRQPSMERALQRSPKSNPRSTYGFRQPSPGAGGNSSRHSVRLSLSHRAHSPISSRVGPDRPDHGSPRRSVTPSEGSRSLVPEHRIQRITSAPQGSFKLQNDRAGAAYNVLTSAAAISRRLTGSLPLSSGQSAG